MSNEKGRKTSKTNRAIPSLKVLDYVFSEPEAAISNKLYSSKFKNEEIEKAFRKSLFNKNYNRCLKTLLFFIFKIFYLSTVYEIIEQGLNSNFYVLSSIGALVNIIWYLNFHKKNCKRFKMVMKKINCLLLLSVSWVFFILNVNKIKADITSGNLSVIFSNSSRGFLSLFNYIIILSSIINIFLFRYQNIWIFISLVYELAAIAYLLFYISPSIIHTANAAKNLKCSYEDYTTQRRLSHVTTTAKNLVKFYFVEEDISQNFFSEGDYLYSND